jgi:hypothetical protein
LPIDENVKENIKDLRFNQHKTIREIAEITGKSSRDIIAVLNESEDKEIIEEENKNVLGKVGIEITISRRSKLLYYSSRTSLILFCGM